MNGNVVLRWVLTPVVAIAAFVVVYPLSILVQNLMNAIVFFGPYASAWWITATANFFTGFLGVYLGAEMAPRHKRLTAAIIGAVYITFVVMAAVLGAAQGYTVPWLALVLNIVGAIGGVVKIFSTYSPLQ